MSFLIILIFTVSFIFQIDNECSTSCGECGRENNSGLNSEETISCLTCIEKFGGESKNANNSLVSTEATSLGINDSEIALKSLTR